MAAEGLQGAPRAVRGQALLEGSIRGAPVGAAPRDVVGCAVTLDDQVTLLITLSRAVVAQVLRGWAGGLLAGGAVRRHARAA